LKVDRVGDDLVTRWVEGVLGRGVAFHRDYFVFQRFLVNYSVDYFSLILNYLISISLEFCKVNIGVGAYGVGIATTGGQGDGPLGALLNISKAPNVPVSANTAVGATGFCSACGSYWHAVWARPIRLHRLGGLY